MFRMSSPSPRLTCTPRLEELEARWVPAVVGTANQNFVEQLYRDILHRTSDSGGLAVWSQFLDSGQLSRDEVIVGIRGSDEGVNNLINDQYVRLLGRSAEAGALPGWRDFLRDHHSSTDLIAQIIGSPEYFQTQGGGTATGFIRAATQDIFGRAATQTELNNGSNLTAAGDRTQFALDRLETDEARRAEVSSFYTSYLRRQADPGGLTGWAQLLNEHDNNSDDDDDDDDDDDGLIGFIDEDKVPSSVSENEDVILSALFISSGEYYQQAQTISSFATIPSVGFASGIPIPVA